MRATAAFSNAVWDGSAAQRAHETLVSLVCRAFRHQNVVTGSDLPGSGSQALGAAIIAANAFRSMRLSARAAMTE
jgi:hypothetical protein